MENTDPAPNEIPMSQMNLEDGMRILNDAEEFAGVRVGDRQLVRVCRDADSDRWVVIYSNPDDTDDIAYKTSTKGGMLALLSGHMQIPEEAQMYYTGNHEPGVTLTSRLPMAAMVHPGYGSSWEDIDVEYDYDHK